ncbi:MAG TPA: hypothetical protein VFY05_00950, partial [Candidatus Angelobacter sp.]|nr:hypothetical protein [Candidatus Angelobacter sp.]
GIIWPSVNKCAIRGGQSLSANFAVVIYESCNTTHMRWSLCLIHIRSLGASMLAGAAQKQP